MFHQKDEPSLKRRLLTSSALVFHHTVVLLLLLNCCCEGQYQVIGPRLPIVAVAGGDIILPCHIKPAMDAASTTVEWTRPDLKPRFVYVWRSGQELLDGQHPSYKRRTSLVINNLKLGDISLKLSNVKLSDKGTYRCFIPTLNIDSTVELVLGSVSSPEIMISKAGVVLDCESRGWYPEPEVLWLDAEGNLLSAGPPETARGPDDLYTVSSRVTVEKRHSNSFTCRVQQKTTNQTRETHITVPGDFFVAPCSSAACVIVSLLACFTCIFAVAFFLWRWRRTKIKTMKASQRETQQLMAESQKRENTEKKTVRILREQAEALKKQRDDLKVQQEKMEILVKDTEMKFQSVEKDGDGRLNSAQGCIKLKEKISVYKWGLHDREVELHQLVLDTDKLLEKTEKVIITTTDRKQEAQDED